jgi:uncharacterized membrane protein YfcA
MSLLGSPLVLGWLALVSFIAGAAKGMTGFGAALVMAPLFSLLIGVPEAGVLIVLVHCVTSMQGARSWVGQVRWRAVAPLALVAVAYTAASANAIMHADATAMRHLVACAVLIVTGMHMLGWRWRHRGGWLPTVAAGAASGALTALGGLGGPPALYYFNGFAQGPALRANLLGYFALLFCTAAAILAMEKRISVAHLCTAGVLTPAFVAGVELGERLSKRLAPCWFDRLVSALLLSSGLLALMS